MKHSIPKEIQKIADTLEGGGFEAYLVGGCLRDLLLKRKPKDWDIATNAIPEEIQKLFSTFAGATPDKPATVYENQFGTVGVKTESEDSTLKVIEVTTYRIEGKYTDKRHPDEIKFAKTIEEDLARRDFTVNAFAMNLSEKGEVIDLYDGQKDLKNKIIRTVGDPKKRFEEDALRLLRAVRFAAELGFSASVEGGSASRGKDRPASGWEIEKNTLQAIREQAGFIEMIAKERIRDEFIKLIMSDEAAKGIILLEDVGLLKFIIPELREGIGCGQNKHHIYTVFDHNVRALNYAAEKKYPIEIRLASLFHDIAKPKTKAGDGPDSTFYNHEIVGAKMTLKILDRLRFSKDIIEKVTHLVRCHLFYYNVGEVTEAGVRRFLSRVGPENVSDLIKVREADRIGSGVPKAVPYKIRHLLFMIDKVKHDPIHPKMLALRGDDVMKVLNIPAGPKIGQILSILLEEVLNDPKKNNREYLEFRAKEFNLFSEEDLIDQAKKARECKEEFESGVETEMKKKYYVR
ncbi:MAG: CCA tRNA nucleotidyltransferase [Patescibacteria group bacterium]|nr:CCA tRNA nucleotidyltransferase [Patescibacteria group bacterium]